MLEERKCDRCGRAVVVSGLAEITICVICASRLISSPDDIISLFGSPSVDKVALATGSTRREVALKLFDLASSFKGVAVVN